MSSDRIMHRRAGLAALLIGALAAHHAYAETTCRSSTFPSATSSCSCRLSHPSRRRSASRSRKSACVLSRRPARRPAAPASGSTQGRWQRQIRQAEFCVFLEGRARFTPADGGATLEIGAGEAAYFLANSLGEWEILEDSRKVYLIFEEGAAA